MGILSVNCTPSSCRHATLKGLFWTRDSAGVGVKLECDGPVFSLGILWACHFEKSCSGREMDGAV